jgi:hypothetical protein
MYISIPIVQFTIVALTKHNKLGELNNRKLFSHSSGNERSKIKADLVSPEISSLGRRTANYLLAMSMCSFLCVCISLFLGVSKLPFHKKNQN